MAEIGGEGGEDSRRRRRDQERKKPLLPPVCAADAAAVDRDAITRNTSHVDLLIAHPFHPPAVISRRLTHARHHDDDSRCGGIGADDGKGEA